MKIFKYLTRLFNRLVTSALVAVILISLCGCAVEDGMGGKSSVHVAEQGGNADAANVTDADTKARGPVRVALLVDESGGFAQYLPKVAGMVADYIHENAVDGGCEVYLIAVDRTPKCIHFFPADEMLGTSEEAVLDKIKQTNAQDGTDVAGAFDKAVDKLREDKGKQPSRLVILGFSDFNADDGTNPSVKFRKLTDYDWKKLRGVDVHLYFASDDGPQKTLLKLLKDAGVSREVLDPNESEHVTPLEKVAADEPN